MKKTYYILLIVSITLITMGCQKSYTPEMILENLKINESEYYWGHLSLNRYYDENSMIENDTEMLVDFANDQVMITYKSDRLVDGNKTRVNDWFFQDAQNNDYIYQQRFIFDEQDEEFKESFSVHEYVSHDRKSDSNQSNYKLIPRLKPDFSTVDLSLLNITYNEIFEFHQIEIVLDYETLCLIEPNLIELGVLNNPYFTFILLIDDNLNLISVSVSGMQDIEVSSGTINPYSLSGTYSHDTVEVVTIQIPNEEALILHRSLAGYPDTP
ncbi:hypothetical protein [Peloplasma aerotolerans]|uniref:Uncharacterized protein n=1 Tax=Peloplasma aerotolerans TaxID=3044389 RepID=A0AAW6UAZ3_9MOLU|nr:hypothetical protein [Mariniplasma sp. M4Ah]MDI6453124.1 hypothetical protein [Mariniplasma sp. M4Ah]